MKEFCELRINNTYIDLLPQTITGNNLGPVTRIIIEVNSIEYQSLKEIAEKVKIEKTESFFYGWGIKRNYSKKELFNATLFHLIIGNVFEPPGEVCETLYDETTACEICGANRKQIGSLKLKKGTIPKKDIAITIAGEIVVSEKFKEAFKQRNLKGLELIPVEFAKSTSDYYQLVATSEIELSQSTVAGINIFDLSTSSEGEIYKCPKGHTIGLNLLSEAYVLNSPSISECDFFVSKQRIGVKRGLLRPEPIYFCSQAFREMAEEEKLIGFEFEIANIE
jgi:ribosomal protein S14